MGGGSGILSYLSAQAGARHIVALEASSMAEKIALVSVSKSFFLGIWTDGYVL
jgi:ribosomal protein L11 methylase PrmA